MTKERNFNQRFGAKVRAKRKLLGMTQLQAANLIPMTERGWWCVEAGRHWASYEIAMRMAEVLDEQSLADMMISDRWTECRICGNGFLNTSNSRRKQICSPQCQNRNQMMLTRKISDKYKEQRTLQLIKAKDRAEAALSRHQVAVMSMCKSCEPTGLCRLPACELRPVSPWPVEKRESA